MAETGTRSWWQLKKLVMTSPDAETLLDVADATEPRATFASSNWENDPMLLNMRDECATASHGAGS